MASTASKVTSPFLPYVEGLRELVKQGGEEGLVDLALDGGTSSAFRSVVPLEERRASGSFFTGKELADYLLDPTTTKLAHRVAADPACGAGDLLLALARLLPRAQTAMATLSLWGGRLSGRDLDPILVRATRLRLALLASQISGEVLNASEGEIADALPEIRVGDGLKCCFSEPTLLLLNPPFGRARARTKWASGLTPRAGVFAAELIEALPHGSTIRAILPDVLRSGTHSRLWREHVGKMLADVQVELWGQFDTTTDVDVFVLKAERQTSSQAIDWGYPVSGSAVVKDAFRVAVGTVVPHRDPDEGLESPFICARDLPQGGEYRAGPTKRRHLGRRFAAPFVAIRRTSRPADGGRRIVATIVRSSEAVLVENHLIVCRPNDRKLATCEALVKVLESEQTSSLLDRRIRCRHLTVGAIKEIPFSQG